MSKIVCKKCVLDSDIPGITINPETGLCHFCETYKPLTEAEKEQYLAEMEEIFDRIKGKGEYDVIYALSGGKDSSYTLYKLKQDYPFLKVLAVLFNNGFISENAIENAKKMCEITGSDYYELTMDRKQLCDAWKKAADSVDAFPKFAKYRASDICNTCISIIKQKLIENAIARNAPVIIFAFTAGQAPNPIIKLNYNFINLSRNLFEKQLEKIGIDDKDESFMIKKSVIQNMDKSNPPMIIHPLCMWDYNEDMVVETVTKIGWKPPKLNDSNSTNCKLNSLACHNHLQKYGIHPYAFDIAGIVRNGDMSREVGLEKLHQELSQPLIDEVSKELKVKVNPLKKS